MNFQAPDKPTELRMRVAALRRQQERLQRQIASESSTPELRLQARADLERVRSEMRAYNLEIIRAATAS